MQSTVANNEMIIVKFLRNTIFFYNVTFQNFVVTL